MSSSFPIFNNDSEDSNKASYLCENPVLAKTHNKDFGISDSFSTLPFLASPPPEGSSHRKLHNSFCKEKQAA